MVRNNDHIVKCKNPFHASRRYMPIIVGINFIVKIIFELRAGSLRKIAGSLTTT